MRGKVSKDNGRIISAEDHPRTCGENGVWEIPEYPHLGSPPHMRGKATETDKNFLLSRITPAHAGKRELVVYAFIYS